MSTLKRLHMQLMPGGGQLAARAAVEKNYREMRNAPRLDGVRAPADGRMYLISNLMPERLAGRDRIWGVLHLAIFIAAVGGLARTLA